MARGTESKGPFKASRPARAPRSSRATRASRRHADSASGRPEDARGALILDRYRTIERLNPTGYGQVVIAWDERMRRRVAIKEIKVPAGTNGESILAEARTAAMLNHPNIVAVHDVELSPGLARIIMEYVEGATLTEISEDLSDDALASVVKQVGAALEYAHRNGVLHLDIKPANILVSIEGHVKIADFGLASLSGTAGHSAAEGGTLGYMPLEQLAGDPVTEATDQWAFAAVLYELVTGEFPYEDEIGRRPTYQRMLEAQRDDEPHLLQSGNLALDEVLMRALARNDESRYLSVAALTDDALDTLGNSDLGRTHLHRLVSELNRDDVDDWLEGIADTKKRRTRDRDERTVEWWQFVDNAAGFLAGGWAVWRGFAAVPSAEFALSLAVAAAVAILTAFVPRLGVVLAALTVGVTLIWGEVWPLGLAVLAVGGLWWYYIGRSSNGLSALATVALALTVEANLPGSKLVEWFPQLFADNRTWINVGVLAFLILVSIPSVRRQWRER